MLKKNDLLKTPFDTYKILEQIGQNQFLLDAIDIILESIMD